jgi:hypothetical protein
MLTKTTIFRGGIVGRNLQVTILREFLINIKIIHFNMLIIKNKRSGNTSLHQLSLLSKILTVHKDIFLLSFLSRAMTH